MPKPLCLMPNQGVSGAPWVYMTSLIRTLPASSAAALRVAGPNAGEQAELGGVSLTNGLRFIFGHNYRQNRSKGLFLHQPHRRINAGQYGWLQEIPGEAPDALSAAQDFCPFGDGVF